MDRCTVAIITHGETGEPLKQVAGIPAAQFWPLVSSLSNSALIYGEQNDIAPHLTPPAIASMILVQQAGYSSVGSFMKAHPVRPTPNLKGE